MGEAGPEITFGLQVWLPQTQTPLPHKNTDLKRLHRLHQRLTHTALTHTQLSHTHSSHTHTAHISVHQPHHQQSQDSW